MTPKEKGWLKEYLEFRKDLFNDLSKEKKTSHPEYSLYRIIQPTGLMYGQSVGHIRYPSSETLDVQDKLKILLVESLISSALLFYDKPIRTPEELSGVFLKTVESIGTFYNKIFPELATPAKTLFGKKRTPLEMAEKILDKRIQRSIRLKDNFWASFFHNSLLFLDVFIFGQWIHTNADQIVTDFFRYEREELRFSVVKIIAATSHSDNVVHPEEVKLLEYFIQGTDLAQEKKKEAMMILEKGVDINDINLPSENSWILRKFFMEIAILTAWADRKVEESEQDFLKRFCTYLGFTDDDLENSMIAIEGFVLEHWEQLEYLQDKQDFQRVRAHYIVRVAKVAERNKGRLINEIQSDKVLLDLLSKARSQELTPGESETVRVRLIQILKTIPTFVIISLPERFLTLPVLMKILPKSLFTDA
jgi:hypothetical protein